MEVVLIRKVITMTDSTFLILKRLESKAMDPKAGDARIDQAEQIRSCWQKRRSNFTRVLNRVLQLAVFLTLPLLPALSSSVLQSDAKREPITIHITDFGINQYWSDQMRVGDSFTNAVFDDPNVDFHHRAYPELDAQRGSQVLIPMPSDDDMRSFTDTELTNRITMDLIKSIDQARKRGIKEFEVQLVQNVRPLGYASESRQKLVERFGAIAYGAIGRMVESVSRDQALVLDASLASNGTHMFARNVERWQPYASRFRSVDMADGRALLPDMRKVLDVLGGERVTITNTKGDYWAPSPLMSGVVKAGRLLGDRRIPPIEASIGNLKTTKQLVREYPSMRAFLIEPLDTRREAHIRRMIDPSARYRVEQIYSTANGVAQYQLSGIQTPLDLRKYSHSVISVPNESGKNGIKWSPPIRVSREIAEGFAANVGALSTVLSELEWLSKKEVYLSQRLDTAQRFYDLGIAIERDIQASGTGQYTLIQSHTVEAASRLTLNKVLKEIGISDFGSTDIVTAGARHIGAGYADIDTIDSYFIGANKLAWATFGLAVTGNTKGAKSFQDVGDALRQLGGAAVLATAKRAFTRANAPSIEEMWRTAQIARASNGLKVQTISEFLTPDLARQQLSRGDINRLDSEAAKISRDFAPAGGISTQHYSVSMDASAASKRDLSNARLMGDLTCKSNRTVIFGDSSTAKLHYERAVARHGAENVRLVQHVPSALERNAISRKFGADSTITIRQSNSNWREITRQGIKQVTPEPPRRRIDPPPINAYSWSGDGPGGPPGGSVSSRSGPGGGGGTPSLSSVTSRYQSPSYGVGGVMLKGAASVSGAETQLGAGSFALLFESNDAGMDIGDLRKFITALWAVYFSDEGPGISIDPIAPGIDKHIVRYIGQVINSDLGRVMRESDYLMKKWSVGTERPDLLPNFRNPDDIAGQKGKMGQMAWSRFWFVPEDMRFRKAGDMLLFDGGRMTLKTEYLSAQMRKKTDEANEQFASDFSNNYAAVAANYPIYQELFDYAKMVSLARYLKDNGVPMLSYLLANKDLILTEDSVGVVDALATKSNYFKNIEIHGGVDLESVPSSKSYVLDEDAVAALARARALYQDDTSINFRTNLENMVFESGGEDYTLVSPQSVALSSSPVAGDTVQTDIALRLGTQPSLELARYYNPEHEDIATFGFGWHLAIPYRLVPEGNERVSFLNVTIPKKMAVENLLGGRREVLTFSKNTYSIAGYVPDALEQSGLVGIFILSDGSFRLADKHGSEFQFNGAGRLTDMILTERYVVSYKYEWETADARIFDRPPFHIEPVGDERVSVLNVSIPKSMQLMDGRGNTREIFVFDVNDDLDVVGYVPMSKEQSPYTQLTLLSNASYKLETRKTAEIFFDGAGRFTTIREPVVRSVVQGNHQIDFQYEFEGSGFRIAAANVIKEGVTAPIYSSHYSYGPDGRLASVRQPHGNEVIIKYKQDAVMQAVR